MPDGRSPNPDSTVVRPPLSNAHPTQALGTRHADAENDSELTQPEVPGHAFSAPGLPNVPGYTVTREIARGGMGFVYAADDPVFGREVAVKVMRPWQDAGRFVVEAKVTAQLPHPGIPPVYALDTLPDGRPFLVMKLIEGRTLADVLKPEARAELPRLLGVFEAICLTVGFAHSRGIVHRDLKPANVMVGAFGEVQVMDWGLARAWKEEGEPDTPPSFTSAPPAPDTPQTEIGSVKGTPAYMAPEQARGEPVDPRADVFALGGLLAVALTRVPPFHADSIGEVVQKAARADLSECFLRLDVCGADPDLIAVAKRCLAARRDDRFADGEAVAAAVAAYRAGVEDRLRAAERDRAAAEARAAEEANTRREAEARSAEQRKRRRLERVTVALVAAFAITGGAVYQWFERREERRQRAEEVAETDRKLADERTRADRQSTEARLKGEAAAEARLKGEQARRGIDAGLKLATDLRKQYRFAAATAALAQAHELATSGAPERVAEIERARADLALAVRLDDIRYRKWIWVNTGGGKGDFDTKIAAPEYRKAFATHGLDLEALPPTEAAARIASSGVRAELVAAVDDWALYEPNDTVRDRLLEVARRADPHPWRDRLRDPANWVNSTVLTKLAEVDPSATTPASLSVLTIVMQRGGLDPLPLLSAAWARHPTDFELAFVLGQLLVGRGDERAVGPHEAARAVRPENPSVWNNLGVVLQHVRDTDGAIAALRETVRLNPGYAKAYHNLGVSLRIKGDKAEAIAAYRESIRLDPAFAPSHNNLGNLLSETRDPVGAIAALRECIRLDPTCAAAYTNLGNLLIIRGDAAGALAALTESVRLDPSDPRVHTNLGFARQETGDVPGAIAAYREAIRRDPNYAMPHYNLGDLLNRKGDVDGAIAAFREVVRIDPKDVPALTNLGGLLAKKGKLDEAVSMYRAALKVDPKCVLALYNLGVALDRKGDREGAIGAFREAVRLDPKDPSARTRLGGVLADTGDLKGAIEEFRAVVRLTPNSPAAHNNLGSALAQNGELDAALESFREVVRFAPKFAQGHHNLGHALRAKGDIEGAVGEFREVVRLDPESAVAHTNLGSLYLQQKKYTDAVACARTAIKLDPKYSTAHAMLGTALQQSGDIPGARAALTEAARLDQRWAGTLAKLPPVTVAPPPREVNRP